MLSALSLGVALSGAWGDLLVLRIEPKLATHNKHLTLYITSLVPGQVLNDIKHNIKLQSRGWPDSTIGKVLALHATTWVVFQVSHMVP